MKVAVEHRPAFTPARVAECLREQYDLDGRLAPLPAEWDQNFRLETRMCEYSPRSSAAGLATR